MLALAIWDMTISGIAGMGLDGLSRSPG